MSRNARQQQLYEQRLAIEKSYQQLVVDYRALGERIAPFVKDWPLTERPHSDAHHTDYEWFTDYFGNAFGQIRFAIEHWKRSTTSHSRFQHAVDDIAAGSDEFTRLYDRLAQDYETQPTHQTALYEAMKNIHTLMVDTHTLINDINDYNAVVKNPRKLMR